MNLVIVKHENCEQKYLFRLPEGKLLGAGQVVRVKTKLGETLATCMCDSFRLDEDGNVYLEILKSFGATEPLAPVIGSYFYTEWDNDNAETLI